MTEDGARPGKADPELMGRLVNRYMKDPVYHRAIHRMVRANAPVDVLRELAILATHDEGPVGERA